MIKLSEISREEAARYMGVRGEPDENVTRLLDKYEPIVRENLRPAYVYRQGNVERTENDLKICGVSLLGNDILRHLEGCERAIILGATVSSEADKLIRQTSVTDMAAALAVDALCSAAIEQVCNAAEEEIFTAMDAAYRTWRFSPGYGDLPISHQKELLFALNAQRRIGLTVTDSFLLIPSKSVTAIIGICDSAPVHTPQGCKACRMRENCAFRKSGGRVCSS